MEIRLDLPTSVSSKADEIAFIDRIIAKLANCGHPYLRSLINPQLRNWFSMRMADDWSCNIAEELDSTYDKLIKADARANTAEVALTAYMKKAQIWKETAMSYDAELPELRKKADAQAEQIRRLQCDLDWQTHRCQLAQDDCDRHMDEIYSLQRQLQNVRNFVDFQI